MKNKVKAIGNKYKRFSEAMNSPLKPRKRGESVSWGQVGKGLYQTGKKIITGRSVFGK